jgi:hypothetical protein
MTLRARQLTRRLALAGAVALLGGCAMMDNMMGGSTVRLAGTLDAAQEVPPSTGTGSGSVSASYDKNSNKLTYEVTYSGLTGPATAAHFHGPAAPGQNAGVVLPFPNATSPIRGETTLTPAQAADLLAGRWYANVHTARHPGGEIRGQVVAR